MRTEIWKKAAGIAVEAGILAVLLSGCGPFGNSDAVKKIGKSGVVGIVIYHNPDADTENGKREQELMDMIASGLSASPEYIEAKSMEEVQSDLLDKTADFAIGGITDTMEIGKKLAKSDKYAYSDLYVVTRRGDYSDSPEAFAGRTLAFTEDLPESAVSWAKEVENLTPVYIDLASVDTGLSERKIDGYVCTLTDAKALADLNGNVQYQNLIGVDSPGYVILTRKEDSRLLSGINTIIGMDFGNEEESESAKGE